MWLEERLLQLERKLAVGGVVAVVAGWQGSGSVVTGAVGLTVKGGCRGGRRS